MAPAAENRTGVVLGLFEEVIDDRKKFAADAIGEEAIIADVAEIVVRDMSDEFGEKVANWKRDDLGGVGVMVKIFEDDGFSVVRFKA